MGYSIIQAQTLAIHLPFKKFVKTVKYFHLLAKAYSTTASNDVHFLFIFYLCMFECILCTLFYVPPFGAINNDDDDDDDDDDITGNIKIASYLYNVL